MSLDTLEPTDDDIAESDDYERGYDDGMFGNPQQGGQSNSYYLGYSDGVDEADESDGDDYGWGW